MKYYEHDGLLRFYLNASMVLASLFAIFAFSVAAYVVYLRRQPPLIIRVEKDGTTSVVGGRGIVTSERNGNTAASPVAAAPSLGPTELEGRACVRIFLERYHNYTPESAQHEFDEALKMMAANLKAQTLQRLDTEHTIENVHKEHVISELEIRSIEHVQNTAWNYLVIGIKKVSHVKSNSEISDSDRMVVRYHLVLVEINRSENNPSGLLISKYGEEQLDGMHEE